MRALRFDRDAAVRHLLRHTYDAAALRINPLVGHFFEARGDDGQQIQPEDALARIRAAISTAVERVFAESGVGRAGIHLQRQREIVERCHLGGEPDKVVQDSMGLERRQFYREKQRARERLARALHALVPARLRSDADCVDVRDLSLAHFRALRQAGDSTAAIRLAETLVPAVEEPERKLELGALLVECYAESGAWREADDLVLAMRRFPCDDARSRATLTWAQGQRAWYLAAFESSVEWSQRTISHLHEASLTHASGVEALLCATYLQLAHSKHMLGEYEAALAALQAARELLETRPGLPPETTVNVLYHLGGFLSTVPGCAEQAERHLQEAYTVATRNALVREASGTALALAQHYSHSGEIERALRIGREGLAISERVRGAASHAWHTLSYACVELAAGNARRALELARKAGRAEGTEVGRLAYAQSVEAEALLRLGDVITALRLAARATIALHGSDQSRRLLHRASRIYREAAQLTGERAAAVIAGEICTERDDREFLEDVRRRRSTA